MKILMVLILAFGCILAGGWIFRFLGRKVSGNKPYFRDMGLGVAFGYVFAALALAWLLWAYAQSHSNDPITANKFSS